MNRMIFVPVAVAVVLASAVQLSAHHSFTAAYDSTKRVEI